MRFMSNEKLNELVEEHLDFLEEQDQIQKENEVDGVEVEKIDDEFEIEID